MTFVKFIDVETNQYLSDEFGRCDRENKCGYFNPPKYNRTENIEYKYTPPPSTSYHDSELVSASGRNFKDNNFVQFLKKEFGEEITKELIKKYLIGTSKKWKGATIFWQIDNKSRIRHGKIMLYDPIGKRKKNYDGKAYISTVRSELKLNDFNLKQCLFGLHLVNEIPTKKIGMVESEKTAILMSVLKPEYIWLSCGSVSGFKYDYLKPIRDYNIVAFPDKSEYNKWLDKSIELNKMGFKIKVSKWLESTSYEDGSDLADVLLQERKEDKSMDTELIERPIETKIKKLANTNPSIKTLVNLFKLTDETGLNIRP